MTEPKPKHTSGYWNAMVITIAVFVILAIVLPGIRIMLLGAALGLAISTFVEYGRERWGQQ